MLKLHPKIEEALRFPGHGTILDGIYASQAIDTSAEVIDIRGTDISSLNEDGVLNTEHNNPDKKDTATFSVIVGRVIFAKKIFSEDDCESERELDYWNKIQLPFIYGASELFDSEDHENAKSVASIIRHYHNRNLPVVVRYSIEGSTLERQGNNLLRTLARRVALTVKPCNRSSYSNLVAEPEKEPTQVGADFINKNEKFISTFEMESKVLIEDPVFSLEQALSSIKGLNKARGPFSGAGFMHQETKQIVPSGPMHDISVLPPGAEDDPNWIHGFITHEGKFLDRQQAAAYVKQPPSHRGLDSFDKEAGGAFGHGITNKPVPDDASLTEHFNSMNKALTLGGSNAMPSTLSGGAALSVEDVGTRRKFLKSQVLAAARDWHGLGKFEDFLKHRLPDADPEFVTRFTNYARAMKFSKSEGPEDYSPKYRLRDLNTTPPPGTKQFKGKHVQPGEVELVAGPFQGTKLKLMHLTDTHAYVKPLSGGAKEIEINKLPRNKEGSHFVINQNPHVVDLPNYVHGDKHSDLGLTQFHEQKELIHGIDLSKEPSSVPFGDTKVNAAPGTSHGWYKNLNGQLGFVKPAIKSKTDDLDPKAPEYINSARREVVFHNVAKNYFGLGEHVPTTALFKHPDTKHEHSVMQLIPNATHVVPGSHSHESISALRSAGDTGQLDKLAIMDTVMGQGDRNRFNYMTTQEHPKVHLNDNAMIFNYDEEGKVPTFLSDYYNSKSQNFNDAKTHPEAIRWLVGLDPFALGAELTSQGVHQSLANKAVVRLLSMQSAAVLGQHKMSDILFAHGKQAFKPVTREVG